MRIIPSSSDHLRGLGTINGPKQTPRRRLPGCDVSALALEKPLEIRCSQFVFLPSRSITVMTEKVVLFNGALWHDCKAPPASRYSQKGSFLESKFFEAKRRRKPEEGEMKGKYIQIWNSGMT